MKLYKYRPKADLIRIVAPELYKYPPLADFISAKPRDFPFSAFGGIKFRLQRKTWSVKALWAF